MSNYRAFMLLFAGVLAVTAVGGFGAPAIADLGPEDTDGEVIHLEHPETIEPNDEFDVTIETANSAGTIVEFDPDGFDVNLESDDAVKITENRIEFLDADADDSTYNIEVDVEGGADGETADISAWVNAEERADAEGETTSTVTIEDEDEAEGEVVNLEHPKIIEPNEEFDVTVETANSAGTIVKIDPDSFEVDLTSDDAVKITDNQVEFLDPDAGDSTYTIEVDVEDGADGNIADITAWINAEERADADEEMASTVTIEDETKGEVINLDHPETIEPDDEFDVIVETANSAGTIVEFDPDGFDIDLASDDAVKITDNQVEFLDADAGDSTYKIEVDIEDGADEGTADITAWVNAEERADADDVTETTTIQVEEDEDDGDDGGGDAGGGGGGGGGAGGGGAPPEGDENGDGDERDDERDTEPSELSDTDLTDDEVVPEGGEPVYGEKVGVDKDYGTATFSDDTSLDEVNFDDVDTATEVTVREYEQVPDEMDSPSGQIIEIAQITPDESGPATLTFTIEDGPENDLTDVSDGISAHHYIDGEWEELEMDVDIADDGQEATITVETDGFSFFAVSADTDQPIEENEESNLTVDVTDAETDDPVTDATLTVDGNESTTDESGSALTLTNGNYSVTVDAPEYEPETEEVELTEDTELPVSLTPEGDEDSDERDEDDEGEEDKPADTDDSDETDDSDSDDTEVDGDDSDSEDTDLDSDDSADDEGEGFTIVVAMIGLITAVVIATQLRRGRKK